MARMGESGRLLTIAAAQRLVSERVSPGPVESVRLADALGRVTAAPVVCDTDYPPFAKAMMDGYAVRAADVGAGVGPWRLRVVGQIAAGHETDVCVGRGEAMQINTGAPMPAGADAVVRVEDTEATPGGGEVLIGVGVAAGRHVDSRAKYVSAGTRVIEAGVRMDAARVAVAAASGAGTVSVYARPVVSILVTGDELVDVTERARGGRIRNSNGPMLAAMVRESGGEVCDLGVAGDDRVLLERGIRAGLERRFLCVCGGVSMGAFDFVPEVLASCGVRVLVRKIAVRPGKPTRIGASASGALVFALPGNPLSAFVMFTLLVRPALAAWSGLGWRPPAVVAARLRGDFEATSDREAYLPGRMTVDGDGMTTVERLLWHGSSDLFGFSRANGLIVRGAGAPPSSSGDTVSVIPLGRFAGHAAGG